MAEQGMITHTELVAKPGTKALVWEYFGLEQDESGKIIDEAHVVCRVCQRKVLARNGNTSNLLSHLRANHAKFTPK